MLKKIINYNCRYVGDLKRPAHSILRPKPQVHQSEFFTAAFYNHQTRDSSNALVAFDCPDVARVIADSTGDDESCVMQFSIQELVDYSSMMKLPMVVIMNMHCDLDEQAEIFEIYYQDPRNTKVLLEPVSDYPHGS